MHFSPKYHLTCYKLSKIYTWFHGSNGLFHVLTQRKRPLLQMKTGFRFASDPIPAAGGRTISTEKCEFGLHTALGAGRTAMVHRFQKYIASDQPLEFSGGRLGYFGTHARHGMCRWRGCIGFGRRAARFTTINLAGRGPSAWTLPSTGIAPITGIRGSRNRHSQPSLHGPRILSQFYKSYNKIITKLLYHRLPTFLRERTPIFHNI